ncbi:hypothetical protein R3P38DRAFT_3358791 [Favolaschia claudopus]|uniref:Uncharacterized protein n=1 Tax=Favolaschia claudopus TaxID=2862362 RepID=A0AAW0B302_9AGAR
MSLTVNGRSPSSFTSTSCLHTSFSQRYLSQLFPSGAVPQWVPLTVYTEAHGFFTVVVRPIVDESPSAIDVSLGLDWNSLMGELLAESGWALQPGFDAAGLFLSSPSSSRCEVSGGGGLAFCGTHSAELPSHSSAGGALLPGAGGAAVVPSAGGAAFSGTGGPVVSSSTGGAGEFDLSRRAGSSGVDYSVVDGFSTESLKGFDLLRRMLSGSRTAMSHNSGCSAVAQGLSGALEQAYFSLTFLLSFTVDDLGALLFASPFIPQRDVRGFATSSGTPYVVGASNIQEAVPQDIGCAWYSLVCY